MKTLNTQLITFGLASLLLAACSDHASETPVNPNATTAVGAEVISVTDAEQLADRVLNFKSVTTRAAGATSSDLVNTYSMPEKPSVPSDAIELSPTLNYPLNGTQGLEYGKTYIIKKGTKITSGLNLNGATLFIEGEFEMNGCWSNGHGYWDSAKNQWISDNGKVYVLGGKVTLEANGSLFNNQSLSFYNYGGTLEFKNKTANFFIDSSDAFYTDCDLNLGEKTLKVDGTFYAKGKVTASGFIPGDKCVANLQGGIEGLDDQDISIEGTVNIEGNLKVNNLTVMGMPTTKFYICSVEAQNKYLINGNDSKAYVSHIKAKTVQHDGTGPIRLVNNSVIECDEFIETNNGRGGVILEGDKATAVVKAGSIRFKGNGADCYTFNSTGTGSQILLDCPLYISDNKTGSYTDFNWHGGVEDGVAPFANGDLILKPAECGFSIVPKDDPTPSPDPVVPDKILDPTGEVVYDHTHDISATCIQPYNGKLYMSYHTRGKGHGACIEVFETDAKKQTSLLQYLQDKEQNLDFNHLMVDGKSTTPQLYVVGNSFKKGAMLARIDINDSGLLNTDVKEIDENTAIMPLTVVPLEKNATKDNPQDENCIVRDGDNLLVMSTRGYEVYDTDLRLLGSKKTAGKAKHIAINGSDMATLYYDGPVADTIQANGVIETFATGDDILTATPKKTFNVGRIAPNNGKNTIAIDGNNLYVCRGAEGLTCIDRTTGTAKWTWTAPLTAETKVVQGNANGVTFDNDYIYLACGGYGVVVFDKNTMVDGKPKIVAKKRATSRNSANYVTLYNGLVYVAYGKSRLQIFQLTDRPTK